MNKILSFEEFKEANTSEQIEAYWELMERLGRANEGLTRCNILFSNLRGDWSDNRHWCRQGRMVVENALNGETSDDILDDEDEHKALAAFPESLTE